MLGGARAWSRDDAPTTRNDVGSVYSESITEADAQSTARFIQGNSAPARATAAQRSALVRRMLAEHGHFVCLALRHLGASESELDDLTQEVFLTVHRRLLDYEERGRARGWLYSICRRVVASQRRKQRRWNHKPIVDSEHDVPMPASQLERLELSESVRHGYRVLEQLPREQRSVFWLYEVEDVPIRQIAEALGVHIQTVYSRLYKARARVVAVAEGMRETAVL